MKTKALEIRDKGTFIAVIAIQARGQDEVESWLLRRSGFGADSDCVILVRMNCSGVDRNASYDPYAWGGRTYVVAHDYIAKHFDELNNGAVIDVEFILGETAEPKKSEREDYL